MSAMSLGLLLKRALDWAAVLHKDQKRKYPGAEVPYVSHIAGVVAVLARHGFDEEVLAAGELHDTIEDCGVTHAQITERFGARVADLVRHASEEDKSSSWEDRKRLYIEHFPNMPWEAQALTLADKIDNFRSIVVCAKDHGDPWPMFKRGKEAQIERFDAIASALHAVPPHALVDEYIATLEELRSL